MENEETPIEKTKILLVDDEENILMAIKRSLRKESLEIHTTTSPETAIDFLRENSYAVIISDYRMPNINGVDLLKDVKEFSPDTFRVLLTGHADLEIVIEAINQGGVHHFLLKPWDNNGLISLISQLVEHYNLMQENKELNFKIEKQNLELKDLNINLERRVSERTQEITTLHKELEGSFMDTIKLLASLINVRNFALGGHVKRVASLSGEMAKAVGLTGRDLLNVEIAAYLHDIGKIGTAEHLLKKRYSEMNEGEQLIVLNHVIVGEGLLRKVKGLEQAALFVRHHHERYGGQGFPDKLMKNNIPLGAQIIAVADAYDNALHNRIKLKVSTEHSSIELLKEGCPELYNPEMVRILVKVLSEQKKNLKLEGDPEVELSIDELEIGMKISRPVITASGRIFLPQDVTIQKGYLEKIQEFNQQDPIVDGIFIYRDSMKK